MEYRVIRDCCTSGNCISCMRVTPLGKPRRIEQIRTSSKTGAKLVARNWREYNARVVEAVSDTEKYMVMNMFSKVADAIEVVVVESSSMPLNRGRSYPIYLPFALGMDRDLWDGMMAKLAVDGVRRTYTRGDDRLLLDVVED